MDQALKILALVTLIEMMIYIGSSVKVHRSLTRLLRMLGLPRIVP